MTEIIPFRGLLYDPQKASLRDVTAPPYDVISQEDKEQLYNRSPHNIVRVDFGKELDTDDDHCNKYTRAIETLRQWIGSGILRYEEEPAFYLYEADYPDKGQRKAMRGIFAAVKLVELGKGVYPHEATRRKAKTDRLNLLHACCAHISPIFSLYNNPDQALSNLLDGVMAGSAPYFSFTSDDDIHHRFWIVRDKEEVSAIRQGIDGRKIFIADGHHRYETSLEYKRQIEEAGLGDINAGYTLMFLVNIAEGGLTILPTHRLVKELPGDPLGLLRRHFDVRRLPDGMDIRQAIAGRRHTFGLYLGREAGGYELTYLGGPYSGQNEIDVIILHELIFDSVYNIGEFAYGMDVDRIMGQVDAGEFKAAFLLNPTQVSDVERVAGEGRRMPSKSTFFYPKIPTGLVITDLHKL